MAQTRTKWLLLQPSTLSNPGQILDPPLIAMSKMLGINVQYTVIKRYHYLKIKPPKALLVKVHTMFTHMPIKMKLLWIPPFNVLPAMLYISTCKIHFGPDSVTHLVSIYKFTAIIYMYSLKPTKHYFCLCYK